MLESVVYVSTLTRLPDASQLYADLRRIRARNRERDITGMLLYSGGNVIQVLEGPTAALDRTLAEIVATPGHSGIDVIWREGSEARTFPDWSMGFRVLGADEAERVEGFSDFLRTGSTDHLDAHNDPLVVLLHAFRDTTR